MKKSELVAQVAKGAGVAKREAEKVLDAFFDTARKAAKKGDEISWPKFGVVGVAKKAGKAASAKKDVAKAAVTKVVETVEKVVHLPSRGDAADEAGVDAAADVVEAPPAATEEAPPVVSEG